MLTNTSPRLRTLLIAAAVIAVVGTALAVAACSDNKKTANDRSGTPEATDAGNGVSPTFGPTTPGPLTPPAISGEPTTTASGLQIIDIVEGSGSAAESGSYIVVNYTGWLEDGTKFDSSYDSGSPYTIHLGETPPQVIPGWEEGIVGMKVGGKRRLIISPDLAYGTDGFTDRRTGQQIIPPNATLTFDVELLQIQQ